MWPMGSTSEQKDYMDFCGFESSDQWALLLWRWKGELDKRVYDFVKTTDTVIDYENASADSYDYIRERNEMKYVIHAAQMILYMVESNEI